MNINFLPKQVFGYLCTFIDAKDRFNLNVTCKKFSNWEKDAPFWGLMQCSEFKDISLVKPIDLSKKISEIRSLTSALMENPSISGCVKLYQQIMISQKAFQIINIKPIDVSRFFEIACILIYSQREVIKFGEFKIEENLLKDFFVLCAEVCLREFCNLEEKTFVGPRLRAYKHVREIMSIYKEHYSHLNINDYEVFVKKLNIIGAKYHLGMTFNTD